MIKYTAHPEVLRKFDSIAKNAQRPWDDHYIFAVSICGSKQAYFECGDFWKHYKVLGESKGGRLLVQFKGHTRGIPAGCVAEYGTVKAAGRG